MYGHSVKYSLAMLHKMPCAYLQVLPKIVFRNHYSMSHGSLFFRLVTLNISIVMFFFRKIKISRENKAERYYTTGLFAKIHFFQKVV
jgi:hypothetical protein